MSSYSDKSETYCKQEHCDIYFFNLHYEVHIKCIETEVSNLMVSSILVFYFLVVYLFQLYSIPAILNYEA
ncbi:hypothetical protein EFL65_09015 [Streptococcus thermophilus]|nr:hypothetical protein [Streptococcus thermophilus]